MKILSMTASFGKLNGTLRVENGLNILTAPNESGKSTWCAFLLAMLYGIDITQRKSKSVTLPEKARYVPWNGAPMEGTMEIEWNGRRITLERTSSQRVPMGFLKVYDTQTGQPVPELTADNCGRVLLGVERSVFERTAFLRQSDLAVTPDVELEQRLNSLITTGDDRSTATTLLKKLRELQNGLSGRSGKICRVESELQNISSTLSEATAIRSRIDHLSARRQQVSAELSRDEAIVRRHEQAESYARWQAALEADANLEHCREVLDELPDQPLPSAVCLATLREQLRTLQKLRSTEPVVPPVNWHPCALSALVFTLLGLIGVFLLFLSISAGLYLLIGGVVGGLISVGVLTAVRKRNAAAASRPEPDREHEAAFWEELAHYSDCKTLSEAEVALERLALSLQRRQAAEDSLRAAEAQRNAIGNAEPAPPVKPPRYSKADALQRVQTGRANLSSVELEIAQLQGRLGTFDDPDQLLARRDQLSEQLTQLRRQAHVIELCQIHLKRANDALQARFAPQIARRAGLIFDRLTDGRYEKLLLQQDMTVETAVRGSPILRPTAALSCGTVDQLYLAVRLAMVDLLLPADAPIILDDALVNFDDRRAAIALDILSELAEERQILLFTCHSREQALLT